MYTNFSHYLLFLSVLFLLIVLLTTILVSMGGILPRTSISHYWVLCFAFVACTICFFCILICYMDSDFTVYNILSNSNIHTPLFYKISATWSNHEGSLLLWCWLVSMYGFLYCYSLAMKSKMNTNTLSPYTEIDYLEWKVQKIKSLPILGKAFLAFWQGERARGIIKSEQAECTYGCPFDSKAKHEPLQPLPVYIWISTCFILFLLTTSNPFLKIAFLSVHSIAELNPVLQDPVLAIHPPLIYAGYVASAIAFSISLSTTALSKNTHTQGEQKSKHFSKAHHFSESCGSGAGNSARFVGSPGED